jgi:DNA repair protein RadA/Sms
MAKSRTRYVCQNCGYLSPAWMGKCPDCGTWNAFLEEAAPSAAVSKAAPAPSGLHPLPLSEIPSGPEGRRRTGIEEFDRVLGGGIVPGSVFLIGGVPGMGKSTLLLQVASVLADAGRRVLYISGEESLGQIRMRADRLGVKAPSLRLLAETDVDSIAALLERDKPDLAIVDSIQTVVSGQFDGLPGNIGQVRYSGQALTAAAKRNGVPVFLVGHVTKDGTLAGPRVLEHLVDGLLMLEGDGQHLYRLLRAVKNRFGSTNEVGLFEMTDAGMMEIRNPSEHLLAERNAGASGTVITVSLEGSRPLLVEVQALVTPTSYGIPQRTATGIDSRRLAIILAVLEKRIGLKFGTLDVFVNAAGGFRLFEPAADLAVAAAVVSSLRDKPLSPKTVMVGEIGLTGEVRGVPQIETRIQEAVRLGFDRVLVPESNLKSLRRKTELRPIGIASVRDAVRMVFETDDGPPRGRGSAEPEG